MKKNISISSKKAFPKLGCVLLFFILFTVSVKGQVAQNGTMYISNNTFFFMSPGATQFSFGTSPASTKTDRTTTTYGKLVFDNGLTWTGANSMHYVDGYVSTLSSSSFTFPVGENSIYAPSKITSIANNTAGIDVAYFNSNPSILIGSSVTSPVVNISTKEYWITKSTTANGVLSLSWNSASDVTTLTNSVLSDLIIAGWNGSTWVEIPSLYDTTSFLGGSSTLVTGSITSSATVNFSTYQVFTLATKGIISTCPPIFAATGPTKTWSGSWSPSAPTQYDPVIINAPYSAGSFICNTLQLNADVTLADNELLEVINGVSGSGKIIMSSSSSVVQRSNDAAPNIKLTKKTRSLQRGDYTYFGTPISGNFYSQLASAKASTGTLTNALDGMYAWNAGSSSSWINLTSTSSGKGFIARIKNQAPFVNFGFFDYVNVPLTGVANNGDVNVSILKSTSPDPDDEGNYNLLGNPYPSAISADKFLETNIDVDGVVYIWKAQTQQAGVSGSYTQADFIAYTKAGSVYPGPVTIQETFNGKIASGQGFMVKALANSSVIFNNCMRINTTNSNNNFNKNLEANSNATIENSFNRFKINMTNTNDVFSQILIGYYPNTTLGYDRLYDASRNSVSSAQLFSVLETDGRQLSINARPSFLSTDVIALGVSKSDNTIETFTISMDEKEGIFADNSIPIYLHDKLLGTYHDFQNGNYNFTTNQTTLLNRFDIVYQNSELSNPDFSMNQVVANIKDAILTVKSSLEMKNIQIFDITGRKIQTIPVNNNKNISKDFFHAQGVYIIKIEFESGEFATQKLINN